MIIFRYINILIIFNWKWFSELCFRKFHSFLLSNCESMLRNCSCANSGWYSRHISEISCKPFLHLSIFTQIGALHEKRRSYQSHAPWSATTSHVGLTCLIWGNVSSFQSAKRYAQTSQNFRHGATILRLKTYARLLADLVDLKVIGWYIFIVFLKWSMHRCEFKNQLMTPIWLCLE